MNLSQKARKAIAAGLAVSTVLWSVAGFALIASAAPHSEGCLVNVSGTVYKIMNGQKRGFTSAEVFMSHGYNFGQVVTANADDAALPTGSIQIYANGTLVKGPNDPLVYLVVNGQKRGFTSGAVFTGLGYSFANIQWAPVNTFTDIPTGSNINSTSETGLPMSGPGPQSVNCSTTGGGDTTLNGTAGDITVTALSTYGDEEVGEDSNDTEVLAFEVEADDSSDVDITSVKVELAQQNSADSVDLTDYASEVSVWMDGEMVGSADADEFTENADDYTKSISLDGAIVRSGETQTFTLAVSALSNLDSGDIDSDDWQIGISSIRFVDGDGVSTTDSLTLDIDDNVVDDTLEEEFDFASFASANNVDMKVALNEGDDDINLAHVIDIDDTQDTDDVEILSFTIEADGDSDLNIQEIPATITTTGETDESVLVSNAQLWHNGASIASDTVVAGGVVVFEDLDVDIDAGEKEEFKITVDIQDTTGAADNADTVMAEVTATQVDAIVAEDEAGERVVDADASGSATGQASALYDAGIMTEFVSSTEARTLTADASGEFDQGSFNITFEVTAFDGDMRVDKSCVEAQTDATGQGVEYTITNSASNATTCVLTSASTDTEDTSNVFEVDQNTTRTFTLTVNATSSADAFAEVSLTSVNWGTATDDTNANYYSFNLGEYKTNAIFLNTF